MRIRGVSSPESKVFLTVDMSESIYNSCALIKDYPDVAGVKIGQGVFMKARKTSAVLAMYKLRGARILFDAKYEEDADQMAVMVPSAMRLADWISIAPAAGVESIRRAARNQDGISRKVVAALPSNSERIFDAALEEVIEANEGLDEKQRVEIVTCNVSHIERVKRAGSFLVIATGIRLDTNRPDDHPMVMRPYEALAAGADYLAVGRAVMSHNLYYGDVFEEVLADIES